MTKSILNNVSIDFKHYIHLAVHRYPSTTNAYDYALRGNDICGCSRNGEEKVTNILFLV